MPATHGTGGLLAPEGSNGTLTATGVNYINSAIWTQWNVTYTATTSSTIPTLSPVTCGTTSNSLTATWSAWNAQYIQITSTGSASTAIITAGTGCGTNIITDVTWTHWNELQHATAEERAAALAQAEGRARTYRVQQERVQLERSAAEKRAEKLLQESLNPKQREELASKGFFTLETIRPTGERRIYRIRRGRSRNVEQVDAAGHRIKTLCAHPAAAVPDSDTMLAQKLMLEAAEDDFLRIANHS